MPPEMSKLFQGSSLVLSGYYYPGQVCVAQGMIVIVGDAPDAPVLLNDTAPWMAGN